MDSEKQETTEQKQAEAEVKTVEKKSENDNTIFVGIKPFMNYVTGVVMQFKTKGQKEVIVSARGKFISKAVDIVEVARRTFLKEEDIVVKDIKISSENFENKEGKRIHVSAIEILLAKK
jgi:DNA-binding protein